MAADLQTNNDPAEKDHDEIIINFKTIAGASADEPNLEGEVDAVLCPPQEWLAGGLPLLLDVSTMNLPKGKRDRLLHATARLGLPLYFHVLEELPGDSTASLETEFIETHKAKGTLVDSTENKALHHLSIQTSPNSAQIRFGAV